MASKVFPPVEPPEPGDAAGLHLYKCGGASAKLRPCAPRPRAAPAGPPRAPHTGRAHLGREYAIAVEEVKIMQERLRECYIKEGVNHLENCKDLREALWKKIHTPNYGAPGPPKHVRRAPAARAHARAAHRRIHRRRYARRAPRPRAPTDAAPRPFVAELQVYVSGLRLRGTDAGASRVVEARYVEKCDDSRPAGRSHLSFTACLPQLASVIVCGAHGTAARPVCRATP